MTGLIKICGISRIGHAEVVASAGADFIGFAFAESRRRVDPATARESIAAAKAVNAGIRSVGLFVGTPPDEIRRIHDFVGFDLVQLHGRPPLIEVAQLGIPTLLSVRAEPGQNRVAILDYVIAAVSDTTELVLVDGYHPALAGGSGVLADWGLAGELSRVVPVLLAGGLNADNVGEAITTVRPAGVDISSGVERDGVKDPELIRRFIAAARAAFDHMDGQISIGTISHDSP